jgi:hypothetical protein
MERRPPNNGMECSEGAFQDECLPDSFDRHLSPPHSSSASRFTAGASAFFILSQSGERPER